MISLSELNTHLAKLDNWSLEENAIIKDYSFITFKETMDFVNKIGDIAEKLNHHPDILISFNKLRLTLRTHSSNTLTEKDFELAREIDKIE